VRALNLGLAFLLELCALAALAYWGYSLDASSAVRWVVALGAPSALALTWSQVAAPTARRRLPRTPLLGFKLLVFTLAAALLYSAGQHALAVLLGAATVLNLGLGVLWGQS
jgi:Protein of unknown function (DUF2568)